MYQLPSGTIYAFVAGGEQNETPLKITMAEAVQYAKEVRPVTLL